MSKEQIKVHKIEETVSLKGVRRALSNTYLDWRQALLELTDNSVDARLQTPKGEPIKPVVVNVIASSDSLVISDRGGQGMGLDGLKRLMHWGESSKGSDDIGQYGVGGKAGMIFFGRKLDLACSADNEDSAYRLTVPDWDKSDGNYEITEASTDKKEGYVVAQISRMRNYNPRNLTLETIAGLLGSVYRPLLQSGAVQMFVGSDPNKKTRVEPLNVPYLQDSEFAQQTYDLETASGEMLRATMGLVDPKDLAQNPFLKPGMRVYYRGRLVVDGFYAGIDPSHLPNLVGEIHVDNAAVLTNKTGFAADNPNWRNAVNALKKPLQAWEKKLETERREDPRLDDERRLAESAKRDLEGILAECGLITKADIPGQSSGRLPATNPDGNRNSETDTTRRSPEGSTPPSHRANEGETKRWGILSRWDVVSFGTIEPQAEIHFPDSGAGGTLQNSSNPRLRINADHPAYEHARREKSAHSLRRYFAETGAYHVVMAIAQETHAGDLGYFDRTYSSLKTKIGEYYLALSSKGGK